MISGVAHLGIRVHDLAVSRSFYEKFGFEFVMGPVGPEPVAILKHPGGVEINLVLNADANSTTNLLMDVPEKHPGYTHVALKVGDLDTMKEFLDAEGFTITGGPNSYPGGARGLFIRDPDGNVIEFYEAARSA